MAQKKTKKTASKAQSKKQTHKKKGKETPPETVSGQITEDTFFDPLDPSEEIVFIRMVALVQAALKQRVPPECLETIKTLEQRLPPEYLEMIKTIEWITVIEKWITIGVLIKDDSAFRKYLVSKLTKEEMFAELETVTSFISEKRELTLSKIVYMPSQFVEVLRKILLVVEGIFCDIRQSYDEMVRLWDKELVCWRATRCYITVNKYSAELEVLRKRLTVEFDLHLATLCEGKNPRSKPKVKFTERDLSRMKQLFSDKPRAMPMVASKTTPKPDAVSSETPKQSASNANTPPTKEEWSNPVNKIRIMTILGFGDNYRKLKTFAKKHPLINAGSRELWQIRIDKMDPKTREKLRKMQS